MSYEVKWSDDALLDFQEILRYLHDNWGTNSVIKFQTKVEKEIDTISEMPGIFPFINKLKRIRRCVLVNYMELEIERERYIIRFLDNRQDPKMIQEELNKY